MSKIANCRIYGLSRYGIGVLFALLGVFAPCHRLAAQDPSPARVMRVIKAFRIITLADTTPINYCGSDFFWSAAGELVDDSTQRPRPKVSTRDQCATIGEETHYTRIGRVRIFPDSVVIEGASRREGRGGHSEAYVFTRRMGQLMFREYRISNVVSH